MNTENSLLENELIIDSIAPAQLKETAMWTKFLAITGYFMSALIAIGAFIIGSMFSKLAGLQGG